MRKGLAVALLASWAFALTGCAGEPDVDQVRWEIERRVPGARFEREEHVHLGRISMGLVRGLVRLVPGDAKEAQSLRHIRGVEVGVYKVRSMPDIEKAEPVLARVEDRLLANDWSLMLRQREPDGHTWMFVRTDADGSLRNLFIVELDEEEMVLVRVDGRFDELFAAAAAQDPRGFLNAKGSDQEPEVTESEEAPVASSDVAYRR